MTGMEIMMGNMLKSMGVDKDAIMAQANNAAALVKGAEERLSILETQANRMEAKLDVLLQRVGVDPKGDNFAAHDSGQLTIFEAPKQLTATAA